MCLLQHVSKNGGVWGVIGTEVTTSLLNGLAITMITVTTIKKRRSKGPGNYDSYLPRFQSWAASSPPPLYPGRPIWPGTRCRSCRRRSSRGRGCHRTWFARRSRPETTSHNGSRQQLGSWGGQWQGKGRKFGTILIPLCKNTSKDEQSDWDGGRGLGRTWPRSGRGYWLTPAWGAGVISLPFTERSPLSFLRPARLPLSVALMMACLVCWKPSQHSPAVIRPQTKTFVKSPQNLSDLSKGLLT